MTQTLTDPNPGLATPVDLTVTPSVRQGALVVFLDIVSDHTPDATVRALTAPGIHPDPVQRVLADLAQDELWRREDQARATDYRRTTVHVPAAERNVWGTSPSQGGRARKDGRDIAAAFLTRRVSR